MTKIKDMFKNIKETLQDERFNFLNQYGQKKSSDELQIAILELLKQKHTDFDWEKEKSVGLNSIGKNKESFDICGINSVENKKVIIEFDNHRADQIAKKFVSRLVYMIDNLGCDILYVIYCYSGTEKSNSNDAKKYIKYCRYIAEKFGIELVDYHTSDLDEKWGGSDG